VSSMSAWLFGGLFKRRARTGRGERPRSISSVTVGVTPHLVEWPPKTVTITRSLPRSGGGREVEARGTGVARFDADQRLCRSRESAVVWRTCARRIQP